MKEIWWVRHGESEANVGAKTSEPHSIKLTGKGMDQAKQVAALIDRQPDLIITSSYFRTQQTAQPTVEKYPDAKAFILDVEEFTYLSPETCNNTTAEERAPRVKEYWARNDAGYCDGPGAESFADFINRCIRALVLINELQGSFIIVFSHQQFISAVLWVLKRGLHRVSNRHMGEFYDYMHQNPVLNGSIKKHGLSDCDLAHLGIADDFKLLGDLRQSDNRLVEDVRVLRSKAEWLEMKLAQIKYGAKSPSRPKGIN